MNYLKDKNVGLVVGQYKILKLSEKQTEGSRPLYDAVCLKCGFVRHGVRKSNLKRQNKNCNHKENFTKWYSSKLKGIFKNMVERCHNHKCKSYRFYGQKGIYVCEEWRNNSQLFNDWAVQNGYQDGLSIDRIDCNKPYCPENCRWISMYDNAKWKSTTTSITVNGITDSGKGWARRLGLGVNHINRMIRKKGIDYTVDYIKEKCNLK